MTFSEKLQIAHANRRHLCVGLDPVPARLPIALRNCPPTDAVRDFCTTIIDVTQSFAAAYKPNLAFFEALGPQGLQVLADVIAHIPSDKIVIADAKRGDIGNTAQLYAQAFFQTLHCDACTVTPYMGRDAILPFLQYEGKAIFVLTHTSNPGAGDFQTLQTEGMPLYQRVAQQIEQWAGTQPGTGCFVVGATDLAVLKQMRTQFPIVPFLIPGVGAQGGDAKAVMEAACTKAGPVLVNSSRGILYASAGDDFAEAAFEAAFVLHQKLAGIDFVS